MHRSLLFVLTLTASMSQAGDFSFFIEDVGGFGSPGIGYYNPSGLTGDIFGRPELPFLSMPGSGPLTGLTPRVAALFQYRIDPATMTPDDLAPAQNPSTAFRYSTTGSVNVNTSPVGGTISLPLQYGFDFKGAPTGPQWVQGKPNNGQDVWVYNNTILNSSTSGFGVVALATTDTTGFGSFASTAFSVPITGGQGRTQYSPVITAASPVQWKIEDGGNGNYYDLIFEKGKPRTWSESLNEAASLSHEGLPGYLATITSAEENQFLYDTFLASMTGYPRFWIGATDEAEEGHWKWITGESFEFHDWIAGEPNNSRGIENYAFIWRGDSPQPWGWNDSPDVAGHDGKEFGFFVEYSHFTVTPSIDVSLDDFGPSGVMGYRFNGGETTYGSAGQFRLDTQNPVGNAAESVSPHAVGFCIELTQNFSSDFHTYNVGDLTLAQDPVGISGPISPEQAALIEQLWALHYDADWPGSGPFSFADITRSMAFSALLYEIIYDFDGVSLASLDLSSGLFELVDGFVLDKNDPTQELPVFDVASFFLSTLSLNYNGPRPQLLALTNAAHQDYLVAVVPEVGTFSLMSALVTLCVGFSLARRFRKEAK